MTRPSDSQSSFTATALAWLVGAFLVAFLVVPVALAVGAGFIHDGHFSLYWFQRVFSNRILMAELGNGVLLATCSTACCLVLAIPMAILQCRTRFRGQAVLGMLVLLPLILPPFVGALSMRRLFGQFGVLNMILDKLGVIDFTAGLPPDWLGAGMAGVVFLQTLHLFPIMYLNAAASLASIDPAYIQASRNLGASRWRTFFAVVLPLMRPGLFAGGTIVFIWAFTDIGTPLVMGYDRVTPVTIFKELARNDFGGRTYTLVLVMLAASLVLYVLGKFVLGRGGDGETSKAGTAEEIPRLGAWASLAAWAFFGTVILLSILPHAGVILMAVSEKWVNTILPGEYTFRHLGHVFQNPDTYRSIFNSVRYAGLATALDLAVGCLIVWLVLRAKVGGRHVLDALAMLPLAIPGLILAAGYVALTVRGSPLAAIGPTQNPFLLIVIAYAVRRLPLVVRGVSAGVTQVPESLEEAARNLGASRLRTAWRITLPLVLPSMIAATVLTFSFAVLEVSDSLILAQVQSTYPITKQIYALASSSGAPDAINMAAALGVYGMLFLGGTLALASLLLGKRLGAVFRA